MKKLIQEFKQFISKGNAFDMAVGVIIGNAFNKIVTSLTNILMSLCTWKVPGGMNGLITVLPAASETQKGMKIAGEYVQSFNINNIQEVAENLALTNYTQAEVDANLQLIESAKTTLLNNYTLHGTTYTYNMCSVVDWGALINAAVSFLIIALTLFVIVKIMGKVNKLRNKAKEKALKEFEELEKKFKGNKEELLEKVNALKEKTKDTAFVKEIDDLLKDIKKKDKKDETKEVTTEEEKVEEAKEE